MDKILNILARGENKAVAKNTEIQEANAFLLGDSQTQPQWLPDFLEGRSNQIQQIVARATGKGLLATEGYAEGYFNEIIQNANDLQEAEGREIAFVLKEEADGKIVVSCTYPDRGFRLEHFYGFCNTGFSSKSEGQTGKFGIGIKSLFDFSESFLIQSNLNMAFSQFRTDEVQCKVEFNPQHNQETNQETALTFSFFPKTETSFNIQKLKSLCDSLGSPQATKEDILPFFTALETKTLIFDLHSLLFMKGVQTISFNHDLVLACQKEENHMATLTIKKGEDVWLEEKYFLPPWGQDKNPHDIQFAFDLSETLKDNRSFSTFYLSSFSKDIAPSMGLCVHTKHSNSFRTAIAENDQIAEKIHDEIQEGLANLMCQMVKTASFTREINSFLFHKVLFAYCDERIPFYTQEIVNGETSLNKAHAFYLCLEKGLTNDVLEKVNTGDILPYIVMEQEQEAYAQDKSPVEAPIYATHIKYVYENIIAQGKVQTLAVILSESNTCHWVKKCYELIQNTENDPEAEAKAFLLNYYGSVKDFLTFRVGTDVGQWMEDSVDTLLKSNQDVDKDYFWHLLAKLLGRYKIVPYFSEYGDVISTKLSFIDYIFNEHSGKANNKLDEILMDRFETKYQEVKACFEPEKHQLNYRYSTRASYNRFTDKDLTPCNPSLKKVSCDPHLLIDAFHENSLLLNSHIQRIDYYGNYLFSEKNLRYFWKNSEDFFSQSFREAFCVPIHYLEDLESQDILHFRKSLDLKGFNFSCRRSCRLSSASPKELKDLSNLLLEYASTFDHSENPFVNNNNLNIFVKIQSLQQEPFKNDLDEKKVAFIQSISGYHIIQLSAPLDTERGIHRVTYFYQGAMYVKTSASSSSPFHSVGTLKANDDSKIDNSLIILSSEGAKEKALDYVLNHLDLGKDILEKITGYIPLRTTATSLNSLRFDRLYLNDSTPLPHDSFMQTNTSDMNPQNLETNKNLKKLLLARGSYHGSCPICGHSLSHDESTLITIEDLQSAPLRTLSCVDCLKDLKSSLSEYHRDGRNITLQFDFVHDHRMHSTQKMFTLSHINEKLLP